MGYKHQGFTNGSTLSAENLIAMENAIIDSSSDSYKYNTSESIAAFVEEMNNKAKLLGATNSNFVDPIGVNNTSTAHDMARIALNASDYEKLYDIWNTPTHPVKLIQPDGTVRTLNVTSTVVSGSKSHVLCNAYKVMGGKTGSLSANNLCNLVAICRSNANENDWYVVAALGANTTDSGTEHRFQAAKEIMDIVESGVGNEPDLLDEIAYENLSYRDIFIKNNKAPRINQNSLNGYTINNGDPVIVSDLDAGSGCAYPYALKCFGTTSQQLISDTSYSNYPYFAASKVKIDRYTAGYCGVAFYANYNASINRVTDGWETVSGMLNDRDGAGNKTATSIFVGSIKSANLDGYVNNPVVIPMSIFTTAPSAETLTQSYETYTEKLIEMGGTDGTSGPDVCCSCAYAIKKPAHNARAYRYIEIDPAYEKNSDTIIKPASTTKILTSIVCLDYIADWNEKVLITQEIVNAVPSGFNGKDVLPGETVTIKDLLYAMMLPSSNVSCCVVARHVGERILRSKHL